MTKGSARLWRSLLVMLIGLCLLASVLPVGAQDLDEYLASGGVELAALPAVDAGSLQDEKPVARFYLFYGETCPHCHEVMDNFLPGVYEKYGDQVEYEYVEVWSDTDSYLLLLALQQMLGVPEERRGSVPVLIIGDKVLVGSRDIPDKLEGHIDDYLAQGGVDYPSLDDLPEVVLPTPEPAVQVLVFFDPGHPDFEAMNAFIAGLGQEYGGGLQAYAADVTNPENAAILAQAHDALGVKTPAPGTPELFVDRRLLVGLEEIQSEFPGLVDDYLAQGGSNLSFLEELVAGGQTPSATSDPSATDTPGLEVTQLAQAPIYMAYFEQAGCQNCARTAYDLKVLEQQYPQLVIESFSMEEDENKALNEWLSDKYGVPEEKRLTTPMIFVGEEVLIGTEATLNNLLAAVGKYASSGAERTWEDYDPEAAEQSLIDRFQSFGLLTVLGAGLIDGLNPCAFATLVFFVSYLAFTGRRGRDILIVGFAFALGVFLTYLLVGVGILKIVQSLSFFTTLGRWVYLITALLCIVLAILTFRDYFRARGGQASEMTLKLPMSFRRRINRVIRENAQTRAFVAMAFVTGFLVSLIELACTGQVYLPTIIYVTSQPELAGQAFLYLVLYCLMFIVPLIVVFGLSYFGTTSEQLGQFVNRHTATIKLVTGLVFTGLALWMTWTMAPLFGVTGTGVWVLMSGVVLVIVLAVVILYSADKRAPKTPAPRRRGSRA